MNALIEHLLQKTMVFVWFANNFISDFLEIFCRIHISLLRSSSVAANSANASAYDVKFQVEFWPKYKLFGYFVFHYFWKGERRRVFLIGTPNFVIPF